MTLFDFVGSLNNETLFLYGVVGMVVFYLFFRMNIGLGVLFALFMVYLVVGYLNDQRVKMIEVQEVEDNEKYNAIEPKSEVLRRYTDIVDFIFSVQDFYIYNPSAFEEFVENLESFIKLREDIVIGVTRCDQYYTVAEMKGHNALNAFQSLIFKLPDDRLVVEKFNRGHVRLNTLVTKYLNDMYSVCNSKVVNYGLDITSKLINTGPKEFNFSGEEGKDFSYSFY